MMFSLFGLAGALPKMLNPTTVGVALCVFFIVLVGSIALRPFKKEIWGFVLKVLKRPASSGGAHADKNSGNGRRLRDVIDRREAADKEIIRRVTDQCQEGRRNLGVGNPEKCSTAEPCKYCQALITKAKEKPEPASPGPGETKP